MAYEAPTDPAKAVAAARSTDATIDELQVLARSPYKFVREYVANNPNVTSGILFGIVPPEVESDTNYGIARAIVRSPRASADILRTLSELIDIARCDGSRRENYRFEELAIAVAVHPNCPPELTLSILARAGRRVREKVAEKSAKDDVLEALLSDPSGRVRSLASARLQRR